MGYDLGIPPRFRTPAIIEQTVSQFGKLLRWHSRDKVLGRVLVKVRYTVPHEVPAKIVMGHTSEISGLGESWTFYPYVLTGNFIDMLLGDEDVPGIWEIIQQQQDQIHDLQMDAQMNQAIPEEQGEIGFAQEDHQEPQLSYSDQDFKMIDSVSSIQIIEQQDDQLPFDGQIVPYGLPLPHLPLTKFPPLVCIAVAQGVFKPLLLATQPIIFRSVHSYPCWDLISIKWIIDIPKLPQLCPSLTCPSLVKKQKSIHPDGKRVAKVLFASSEITSDPEVRQGRARKHKIQTPVSTEGLRRSPRFTGLGEKLEIHTDTPKKKTKVKPMVTSFKPSKDDRVKHLPSAIAVAQLQKIGLEKCGLLLEEVADGKLLQNKDD